MSVGRVKMGDAARCACVSAVLCLSTLGCESDSAPFGEMMGEPMRRDLMNSGGAGGFGGLTGSGGEATGGAVTGGTNNSSTGGMSSECAEDCDEALCAAPPKVQLATGSVVHAATLTKGKTQLFPSCAGVPGAGVQAVFELVLNGLSEFEVTVDSLPGASVSVRTSCDDYRTERLCASGGLSDFSEGLESVHIVVDAPATYQGEEFEFTVRGAGENSCGDGVLAPSEECEPSELSEGECSPSCRWILGEVEPNDSAQSAHPLGVDESVLGRVSSELDYDYFNLSLAESQSVEIAVESPGGLGCEEDSPGENPVVEVLDSNGDLVAWDDDSGLGECPLLDSLDLDAGDYSLVVYGASGGRFPYRLSVFGVD